MRHAVDLEWSDVVVAAVAAAVDVVVAVVVVAFAVDKDVLEILASYPSQNLFPASQ